jgi:hypothetical protein
MCSHIRNGHMRHFILIYSRRHLHELWDSMTKHDLLLIQFNQAAMDSLQPQWCGPRSLHVLIQNRMTFFDAFHASNATNERFAARYYLCTGNPLGSCLRSSC